jgi:N-glycosidase YbiA
MRPESIPPDRSAERAIIRFYATDKPYGSFSNFSSHPVQADERLWPTSEHYFQSLKFATRKDQEDVRAAAKPFMAAQIGRDRTRPLRPDWLEVRDDMMRKALRAKFDQHEDLHNLLQSTHGALIIEHTVNDSYWGDGGDGTGQNRLGELLMELRRDYCGPSQPIFRVPHWFRYPEPEAGGMFWRMGFGESDWLDYQQWRTTLHGLALTDYDRYFPEPEEWRTGFRDNGKTPR